MTTRKLGWLIWAAFIVAMFAAAAWSELRRRAAPLPSCPAIQYRDAFSPQVGPGAFLTVEQMQALLLTLDGLSKGTCRWTPGPRVET